MNFKIPSEFSVGGFDYRVERAESLRYGEEFGHWTGANCTIKIADAAGGEVLTDARKEQTFFHELVHAILDVIGEAELTDNEKFVDAFAAMLHQAIKTMK